ncbi:hypothetical protein BBJ28_00008990 [Nothophytophthora sp. Chile5]|nr:hypothetical protein BBJ28_00008990 [Nothophytophthora sp. Chile5]
MEIPEPSLSSPSTLSSTPSLLRIGQGSFSPGDVYVECVLPKVLTKEREPELLPRSGNTSKGWKAKKETSLSPESSDESAGGSTGPTEMVVLPLAEHPAFLHAQEECRCLLNGNDVRVLEDETVQEGVVQVLGTDAELVFPVRSIFRYLVLFVKNLELFLEFHVQVLDDSQTYRQFTVTNARSLARVDLSTCQLPLSFGSQPGWRYLCMDLQELTRQAFGTRHVTTTEVRVGGNCRLLRLFFQDERYADADLPAYLTFLG